MTRINVVPPTELCDQHLLAEHRELTRIPNCIAKGRYRLDSMPSEYKLGTGHVKFFYNKLKFLMRRYNELHKECLARGFNVTYIWPDDLTVSNNLWQDYKPTSKAIDINRARINERMPVKARFTKYK